MRTLIIDDDWKSESSRQQVTSKLFDKYCQTMKSRLNSNTGIIYLLRSRCKTCKGKFVSVEILGGWE